MRNLRESRGRFLVLVQAATAHTLCSGTFQSCPLRCDLGQTGPRPDSFRSSSLTPTLSTPGICILPHRARTSLSQSPPPLADALSQDRRFILDTMLNGLQRMEYRGYDSAGLEIEGDEPGKPLIFKEVGKVQFLKKHCLESPVDMTKTFLSQTSIAHTRFVECPLFVG